VRVGIEKLDMYAGRFCADARELAASWGKDPRPVMQDERSVVPPFEDSVTLAVNAGKRLLRGESTKDIELCIVSTESAVDYSKAAATWVHRYCGLPANCRTLETKHACYGGTGAFKMAASWVASQVRPGKKALVISSDLTRADMIETGLGFIGGGAAVAMLVSGQPEVLELDLRKAGFWTTEIDDTHRPTARHEIIHSETSLYAYLDALEGAIEHFEEIAGGEEFPDGFRKHIYHVPFPGMAFQAHKLLLERAGILDRALIQESFERKVEQSIRWGRRIGTSYGASTFICLLSLLAAAEDLQPGDPISMFAYGSGCQGEFYEARVGNRAREIALAASVHEHLDDRRLLSPERFERFECARQASLEQPCLEMVAPEFQEEYDALYAGRNLLILKNVQDFHREYAWS